MQYIPNISQKINSKHGSGDWLLNQLMGSVRSPDEILASIGISPDSSDGRAILFAFGLFESVESAEEGYRFAPEVSRVFCEILTARRKRLDKMKRRPRSRAGSPSRGGKP